MMKAKLTVVTYDYRFSQADGERNLSKALREYGGEEDKAFYEALVAEMMVIDDLEIIVESRIAGLGNPAGVSFDFIFPSVLSKDEIKDNAIFFFARLTNYFSTKEIEYRGKMAVNLKSLKDEGADEFIHSHVSFHLGV